MVDNITNLPADSMEEDFVSKVSISRPKLNSASSRLSLNSLLQRSRKRSRSVSIESNSVESESHETASVASNQQVVTDYFPAGKLFEYQWPLGDEGAEHYMLQEHVKEFLDIRGMQRKYPGVCVCLIFWGVLT